MRTIKSSLKLFHLSDFAIHIQSKGKFQLVFLPTRNKIFFIQVAWIYGTYTSTCHTLRHHLDFTDTRPPSTFGECLLGACMQDSYFQ